jgi:hypothetical protein
MAHRLIQYLVGECENSALLHSSLNVQSAHLRSACPLSIQRVRRDSPCGYFLSCPSTVEEDYAECLEIESLFSVLRELEVKLCELGEPGSKIWAL